MAQREGLRFVGFLCSAGFSTVWRHTRSHWYVCVISGLVVLMFPCKYLMKTQQCWGDRQPLWPMAGLRWTEQSRWWATSRQRCCPDLCVRLCVYVWLHSLLQLDPCLCWTVRSTAWELTKYRPFFSFGFTACFKNFHHEVDWFLWNEHKLWNHRKCCFQLAFSPQYHYLIELSVSICLHYVSVTLFLDNQLSFSFFEWSFTQCMFCIQWFCHS